MFTNWELLYIFLEVARAGTLRQATRTLPYTQPTLGKKIDLLEAELKTKLFFRTRAGLTLTSAGEHLLDIAEKTEQTMRLLAQEMSVGSSLVGRLRLTMTDGMAGYWLAPHLKRFHRENPHVTLDLQVTDSTVPVDLTKRETDLTIVYNFPDDPDVVVLRRSTITLVPVCSQDFVKHWGRPSSVEDVVHFPVLAHTMHFMKSGGMRPWAEMLERHPMIACRTGSSLTLYNIARTGVGLSLQPIGLLDREEDAVHLDFGFKVEVPFYLVCHRNLKDAPIVRRMISCLADHVFSDDGIGSPSKKSTGHAA